MKNIFILLLIFGGCLTSCYHEDGIVSDINKTHIYISEGKELNNCELHYQLYLKNNNPKKTSEIKGVTKLDKEGFGYLPCFQEEVVDGYLCVAEGGQNKYNLENLGSIFINYDSNENSYLGITTWEKYLYYSAIANTINFLSIQSKIQFFTNLDDYVAVQKVGMDVDNLKVEASLYTESGILTIPNKGNIGDIVLIEDNPHVLLFENEIIVYENELKSFDLIFSTPDGRNLVIPFHNIPVKPNSTTTITDVSLTTDVFFNIIVNPGFGGDLNVERSRILHLE